jgi:hypothetical protein
VAGTSLEFVEDLDKSLVVPVRFGIVFYEVQVGTVREGLDVCVPVGPILIQICTNLPIVEFGPVTGNTCDVIFFENFLNALDGVSTVDDGPGTTRVVEETTNIE